MSRVAVPEYVSKHGFANCPPGHRFNLYLDVWNDRWGIDRKDGAKSDALHQTLKLGDAAAMLTALLRRQQMLAQAFALERCLTIDAQSTSPFATGLGLEHPIENGFAFLSPYGLPYLAGSGVKGVLRRAAEELGEEGDPGFGNERISALFGPEDTDNARRGALAFWDVFPVPQGDAMMVEIMTPHYSHYYQPKSGEEVYATPHDAGKPNPIPFLAIPAGSSLRFIVTCELSLLPPELLDSWSNLMLNAFNRAFDWLGFGAKTAVGYGAVRQLTPEEVASKRTASEASAVRCDWVDATIRELAAKNRASEMDTLRGKGLAEAWTALNDPELKARALADIRTRWQAQEGNWWDKPPGGASKKAKAIYDGNP